MGKYLGQSLLVWIAAFAFVWSLASYGQERQGRVSTRISNAETYERCSNRNIGELFARTELFFGRSKPDGSVVTEKEFRRFLDEVITPRFPEGLTAVSGNGQFRGSSGVVMRENAVFVILLYPPSGAGSNARIEEIREAYRQTFNQESVLRADSQSCVSF